MSKLDMVELSRGITIKEVDEGSNAVIRRLKDYPKWDKLHPLTQRALFYYESYCDGYDSALGDFCKLIQTINAGGNVEELLKEFEDKAVSLCGGRTHKSVPA